MELFLKNFLNSLNGWRRIALTFSVLWILALLTVFISETRDGSTSKKDYSGVFVSHDLAEGTIFELNNDPSKSTLTFPNGKVVVIDASDKKTGKALNPWDLDWSDFPQVDKVFSIRWRKLYLFLSLPFLLWSAIELSVKVIDWIVAGFKKTNMPKS